MPQVSNSSASVGMWSGRPARDAVADRLAPEEAAEDAVVVEHGHTVGGEPDVALQAGGAEPQGQLEGLEGVLPGVAAGASMGEADRRHEEAGEPLLHGEIMPAAPPAPEPSG